MTTRPRLQGALALLALSMGCGDSALPPETEGVLFRGTVKLEDQLARLAEFGLSPSEGYLEADLYAFADRQELERTPYRPLVEALAMDLEREPWSPLCDALWLCDFERIEDQGSYREVVLRLERMTGSALGLSDVEDHVDLEQASAWIAFMHAGQRVRWDLEVTDDWLDPRVLVEYDELLQDSGIAPRLYGNFRDYGQSALLVALAPERVAEFRKLTGIQLVPVADS